MRTLLLALMLGILPLTGCNDASSDDESSGRDDDDDDDDEREGGKPDFENDTPLLSEDEAPERDCTPHACDDLGIECGVVADGCGDLLDCGGCDDGQACGIVERHVCTTLSDLCVPLEEEQACEGKRCGVEGDGCGGSYDCGECEAGEICGLLAPFECAEAIETSDEECPAKISDCKAAGVQCGLMGNGCGGLIDCDEETGGCDEGETCGVSEPGQCGNGSCEPRSQAEACEDVQCGRVSDGCSGSYDCGGCEGGEECGVRAPFQCDAPAAGCEPRSAEQACAGKQCGLVYDGCGAEEANLIDCSDVSGGCDDGELCGATDPFTCGTLPAPECEASDGCAELGWECGIAVDDCGQLHDCANEGLSCDTRTESCIGGIDGPALCQSGVQAEIDTDCELCDAVVQCGDDKPPTKLVGRVFTPGRSDQDEANQLGVPRAFVYILQTKNAGDLPAIQTGLPSDGSNCDLCNDQELGPVLAGTTANSLGEFTLQGNIPVGEEFLLVVKIGKFRRAIPFELPANAACKTTTLPRLTTRLPRDMQDGLAVNIPRVAIVTGQIDAMECVFEKMGISTSEFAQPGPDGDASARIHLYGADGARLADGFTDELELISDLARLESYDMLVFDCQGSGYPDHDSHDPRVRQYVNRGGRLFASHFSFTWLNDNGQDAYTPDNPENTGLAPSATWNAGAASDLDLGTGLISIDRPNANPIKIEQFATWLLDVGSANADHEIEIIEPRDLAVSVGSSAEEYVYRQATLTTTSVQQFAFNTPYGAPEEALCGRVTYSGFHVSSGGVPDAFSGVTFPDHCDGSTGLDADLTSQEKILAYMLFDLASCVTTDGPEPPACSPVTDCDGRCGELPDGCGGTLSCSCPGSDVCLAGGLCGPPTCERTSCEAETAECGVIRDGCGGELDCGDCPPPQVCGGGGTPHECGGACLPMSCESEEAECGLLGDGCGDAVDCGQCPEGRFCVDHRCLGCEPLSCEDVEAECGKIGDGCGEAVDCGTCPEGEACGVSEPNRCGPSDECAPRSCEDIDAECGLIGDGCGDTVDCGECPEDEVCGIERPFRCGPPPKCEPTTCEEAGAGCGLIGDGCGDSLDCGECPAGLICGFVNPNECSSPAR